MENIKYDYYGDQYTPDKLSIADDYPMSPHMVSYRAYIGAYLGSGEFDRDIEEVEAEILGLPRSTVVGAELSHSSATTVDTKLIQLFHDSDNPGTYLSATKPKTSRSTRRSKRSKSGAGLETSSSGGDDSTGSGDDSIRDCCPDYGDKTESAVLGSGGAAETTSAPPSVPKVADSSKTNRGSIIDFLIN